MAEQKSFTDALKLGPGKECDAAWDSIPLITEMETPPKMHSLARIRVMAQDIGSQMYEAFYTDTAGQVLFHPSS